MRKEPRTLLIGGTQTSSGKSLLTLALANVLHDLGVSVTIVNCYYDSVTWTRTALNQRQHQWTSDLKTTEQLENFWPDLQFVKTDYLLIDLDSTGPDHANYTWLLNQCWLPKANDVILTYSEHVDLSDQLFSDLGTLQFSMEYTARHPKVYTVFNDCPAATAVKQTIPAKELVPFHRQFQLQHTEFAAIDLQPLGTLHDARQNPEIILDDAQALLVNMCA